MADIISVVTTLLACFGVYQLGRKVTRWFLNRRKSNDYDPYQ